MMHGDLDFYVVRDNPYTSDEIVRIVGDLYKQGKFRSYFIKGDWDDPRLGEVFPNGHYVGMKIRRGEEKWVFDVWFVERKEYEERKKGFHIGKVDLTEKQRNTILKMKKERNDRNLSVSGQEIYIAVLEHGETDINRLIG